MAENRATLEQSLRAAMADLTPAERRLGGVLLADFPMSGLGTVTELAEAAGVSAPTVVRMVQKLGFDGFGAFQKALREDVAQRIKAPIPRRDAWRGAGDEAHILPRFAEAVAANIRATLRRVEPASFDAAVALLADAERPVYVGGGRITRSAADYLYNHLQILRPGVRHLGQSPNVWPQHLVDMAPGTVLVLFDIRRYEAELLKLARLATERGAALVLFTDPWGSPAGRHADVEINAGVEVPSSWDSTAAMTVVIEALIAAVQEARWDDSRARIEALEGMFRQTRLFRDFS
ncbi:MurR/RpiR family transcriptional regulator [Rhodobacteraceae bacterium CCMM004]|nr:MurR/RpiR family transcriptional regulator [Rhodobacteraceae bacterium CCMM004]